MIPTCDIRQGDWYYWNFRKAVNVRLKAIKSDVHRPEFWYCEDYDGERFCVENCDLSEDKK